MRKIRTVRELGDALWDAFKNDPNIDEYNDAKIAQHMRQAVGSKNFKEYDELNENQWREAWSVFTKIQNGKLKR